MADTIPRRQRPGARPTSASASKRSNVTIPKYDPEPVSRRTPKSKKSSASSKKSTVTPRSSRSSRGRSEGRDDVNPSARGLSVSSARSGMTSGSRKSDAEDDSVGSDLDEVSIALKGRARVNRLLSERAKEREDPTLAQLADYGSDEEREGREGSARPQAQGQEEEHILTAENILRTSPVYDLHRTIMTGAENAAVQETWRMGADSFRVSTTSGVDGAITLSTPQALMAEAAWSVKEGRMLARQLAEKLRLLEEQLIDLVNVPNPTSGDMNLDGLIRWAPESVVMKAQRTIASLDPSDRITVERLAQNWTEQLHMEEDFINGVYHHLYYTLQMVWERILKNLDAAADEVETSQAKFQAQLDHLNQSLAQELSGKKSSAFHHSHNRFAGMVDYNSFCVTNGLPLFEDAGYRTFDEFCSHWKENHRILVQRRMLWHIAGSSSFDDPKGIASSSSAMMGGGGPLSARLGKKGSKKGSRRTRRSSGSEAEDLSALLEADLHKAEMSGRTEAANRDSFADSKRARIEETENEHIRLLKLVRDTHVWSDGRRYCEVRAEAAWKSTITNLARTMAERAKRGREQEESLEVGRFKHLDMEFQRRVHALRLEEYVLKSRLRHRAEKDLNLTRVCIALRRQRKPVRRHMHRIVLLRHLKNIRPIVEQVVSRLEPLRAGGDEEEGEGDTSSQYAY